jgi:hypothetical protein
MSKPEYLREAEEMDDELRATREYDDFVARRDAVVRKEAPVVVRRRAPAPAPEPETPFTETQQDVLARFIALLHDSIDAERKELREAVERGARRIADLEGVTTMISADVTAAADRARDRLDAAVAEVRAEVRSILEAQIERGAQALEVRKQATEARVELERQRSATALAERDHRIEKLETRVQMLCQFLSVSGYDLPRGF